MKTPVKNKKERDPKAEKPKLKTERPLAEKDEVKQAEAKQRKN